MRWVVGFVDEMVFPGSQYVYHDDSPKPVTLALGNGHISIPRDYVETYFPPSGKDIGSLMIGAFLPNFVPERVYEDSHPNLAFHPWTPPDLKEYDKALVQVQISSSTPARPDLSVQANLDQGTKNMEQLYTFDFSELKNFDEWVDGHGDKLFVHRGTDHYSIDCSYGCSISYVYRNTFDIILYFDPTNLLYAESIMDNFNKFLDTKMKVLN
jgi:hypothetical protein